MELFSGIHNRYFYIIGEILKTAATHKISAEEIVALVTQLGFAESPLFLTPSLQNKDGGGYSLLKKKNSRRLCLHPESSADSATDRPAKALAKNHAE